MRYVTKKKKKKKKQDFSLSFLVWRTLPVVDKTPCVSEESISVHLFSPYRIPEVVVIASDKICHYVTKQDTQRGWNARLKLEIYKTTCGCLPAADSTQVLTTREREFLKSHQLFSAFH